MKTDIYKRVVRFHDAENILVTSELKITTRNGYPEFTMCNERAGHHGQAEFVPKDGYQSDLHNYWDNLHLKEIPNKVEDMIEMLDELCDNIEEEESNRFENGIEDWDDIFDNDGNLRDELSNLKDEKIIALGKHLDLTPTEANEDIEQSSYDDCIYSYSGTEYLVCTDEEADERWDEELEYYIDECIICELPKAYKDYFDRESWKSDAKCDGRGYSLGRYDGIEHEEIVNNTYYYIYKQ